MVSKGTKLYIIGIVGFFVCYFVGEWGLENVTNPWFFVGVLLGCILSIVSAISSLFLWALEAP